MAKLVSHEQPPVLEVSEETERKLTVFTALKCVQDGSMSEDAAVSAFEITREELDTYKPLWEKLFG